MSPPNAPSHPDDPQNIPHEDRQENGLAKAVEALTVQPEAGNDIVKQPDATSGIGESKITSHDDPLLATEQSQHCNEQTSAEEQFESSSQDKTSSIEQNDKERPEALTAQEQSRTGSESVARSSTPPPPEPSNSAGKAPIRSPSPPPPPPKDDKYISLDHGTPHRTISPVSQGRSSGRTSEDTAAAAYNPRYGGSEDVADGSKSEIQSIMEQFELGAEAPGEDEIMSPRLELASPLLDSPITHPPRRSSLQPIDKPLPGLTETAPSDQQLHSPPPRASSLYRVGTNQSKESMSPSGHAKDYTPHVPQPPPEPDLPFDFHRFLEQLRHRTADPVAKFLRSFLLEFGKKQWMAHEQVKIISDFLEFIAKKMAQCEVWRTVSDAEFDNAREGMEKLVMNRLYNQTFSPAIPPPEPVHPTRGKRKADQLPPGRRGAHQEDVERDEVLAQKVRIYKWVREEHLDIEPVGDKGRKFLQLAQQELLKINSYRAPRDKVICILNCCKVIFGFLRTSTKSDQSADSFVPLLIYTVLQANPDHLVSNVQYIMRFRNKDKLGGEAGYYIFSLMGAIQFIEGLDRTSLTVSDEDFERNVEAAVSAIAERHPDPEPTAPDPAPAPQLRPPETPGGSHRRMGSPHLHLSEKSALSRPEVTPRNSLDGERAGPIRASSYRNTKEEASEPEEENAAVAGLLRTIQKPLSTIGRIFSDNDTPTSASTSRLSPQPANSGHERRPSDYAGILPPQVNEKEQMRRSADEQRHRERLSAEDAAARQASAEAEEARRIQRQEHMVIVETLAGMFPALDREVIDDVVRMKEGRVGLAVDACLALSNP
ncbi:uncharacterized protein EI97DRAFT_287700 [Westerdykella ornata]|uniref:VPS9 domain-containing protein n=1 Tax=Westerdykella ornata TaxID=318751 RepID=A0A6A6JM73_WESOR|nr:uncharacterized protein EI97DRAFT_287700 [Westerdykella ornata]KAF2277334.1 hypothetical protein EI97DRAFT_287700 [Westerdykella ornata]